MSLVSDQTREESLLGALRQAARRDGGNPRTFLELLATSVEDSIWENLPEPVTFLQFLKRADIEVADLEALLNVPSRGDRLPEEKVRLDRMRRQVRELLEPALAANGELGNGRQSSPDNIRPTQYGTSAVDTRRRLRRDHPELLERVEAGEFSANEAAIEAGFRKRKATVPVDTPVAAVGALLRRFTWQELKDALDDAASPSNGSKKTKGKVK